jgi:hypothetical protein
VGSQVGSVKNGGCSDRESRGLVASTRARLRDARLALRVLARACAFTATAVLSLALGIGATTAIFSVVHALLLRPLPYTDADRLVILWNRSPGLNITPPCCG